MNDPLTENPKVGCQTRRCGWNGRESDLLKAPHPFIEGETIIGCPGQMTCATCATSPAVY